jgi:hypothetical protein
MTKQQALAQLYANNPELGIKLENALNIRDDKKRQQAKRVMMTAVNQPNYEMKRRYIEKMASKMQSEGNQVWAQGLNDLLQLPDCSCPRVR